MANNKKPKYDDINKLLKKNLYNHEKMDLENIQHESDFYLLDYVIRTLYEKKRYQKKIEKLNLEKKIEERYGQKSDEQRAQKRVRRL
jgi:hypothetical protein